MSDHVPPSFTNELLGVEQQTHPTQTELVEELNTMMTRELTRGKRIWFRCLAGVISVVACLTMTLVVTEDLPLLARAVLTLGSCFAVAWAWKLGSMSLQEKIDVRRDGRAIANMVWCFTLAMSVIMMMTAGLKADLSNRQLAIITGQALLFIIVAGVYFLAQRLEESELVTRERLLRLELQLTQQHNVAASSTSE